MSTVLIVLIVFGFGAYIVKMGLEHDRASRSGPSTDNSLTASELRRMIAESVEDATSEITTRLDRMERRLEGPNHERTLPPASSEEERFDDPTYR